MNARRLSVFLLLLNVSLPASAGVVLRQVQVTESTNEEMNSRQVTQVFIEGEKMKTVFEESTHPMMPVGSYLLAPGGDLMYLVNPARRTISRMDIAEMEAIGDKGLEMGEKQAESTGLKTEVVDARLEQKLDETGPAMLGFPTRHYRYELSYTEKQHMTGMPGSLNTKVEEQHEFWATEALNDEPAIRELGAAATAGAAGLADVLREVEDLEARMHAHGLFLKHVASRKTSTAMSGGGGLMRMMPGMSDSSADRISTEVTELKRATITPAEFELPKGYEEIELFAPAATGMPDLDGLPGAGGEGEGTPALDKLPR